MTGARRSHVLPAGKTGEAGPWNFAHDGVQNIPDHKKTTDGNSLVEGESLPAHKNNPKGEHLSVCWHRCCIIIALILCSQMKFLFPIGAAIFILGLFLAFFEHSDIWYSFFLIGGFLLLEGVNYTDGFSVLKNPRRFLETCLIFLGITVLIEIIGNFWLNLWNYPTFGRLDYFIHVLIIGYVFTFFFGLEFFVLIKRLVRSKPVRVIVLPIAAILFGYLSEYPNTFAFEWKYINWPFAEFLGIPVFVSLLWLLLLSVMPFEKLFRRD